MLRLCIEVDSSGFFFSPATDMSSIFWCSWRALKLKFCVQNGVGTAQLYRKQLACADAPSPIAGGDHVWESLRDTCDSAIRQSRDGDDSPVSEDSSHIRVKNWHFLKLFQSAGKQKPVQYPIEAAEVKTRLGQRILTGDSNPSSISSWAIWLFSYLHVVRQSSGRSRTHFCHAIFAQFLH